MSDESVVAVAVSDCSKNRDWTRFPPDRPETVIIAEGKPTIAVVLDESFGGIGVLLEIDDGAQLRVGDSVIVLHCDCPTPGRVQWVQDNSAIRRLRVGICWNS